MKKIIKKRVFLFTCLLFAPVLIFAQPRGYKTYTNSAHHFSFQIPSAWKVIYSKKQGGLICVPTTPSEKTDYNECFEGIVFRVDIENTLVDSLLNGILQKKDESYYTVASRFGDTVAVKKTYGRNWKGIDYTNYCGIDCKETGFHAAAGECAFLFFAGKKETVLITTNGRDFDPQVRKRIISSFSFGK